MSKKDDEVGTATKPKFRAFDSHPFLQFFPTGCEEDIQAMKLSVIRIGVQQKIRVWKDSRNKYHLIDGTVRQEGARRAFEDCLAADPPQPPVAENGVDLQPEVEEFVGTQDEVYEFIKTTHVRKHYTQGQRSAIGVSIYYHEYKKNHAGALPDPQAEVSGEGALSAEELAQIWSVNPYYIRICRQLYREATDLLETVRLGGLPPTKAKSELDKRRAGDAPVVPGEEDGEAKSPDKVYDDENVEVPENLLEVWESKTVFGTMRKALTEQRGNATTLAASEGGGFIEQEVLNRQFGVVLAHLYNAEPLLVCSDCTGKGYRYGHKDRKCARCKELGYLCRAVVNAEKKAKDKK